MVEQLKKHTTIIHISHIKVCFNMKINTSDNFALNLLVSIQSSMQQKQEI